MLFIFRLKYLKYCSFLQNQKQTVKHIFFFLSFFKINIFYHILNESFSDFQVSGTILNSCYVKKRLYFCLKNKFIKMLISETNKGFLFYCGKNEEEKT